MTLPNSILQMSTIFISIIIEAIPFVLFGCLVTGFLQSFLNAEKVSRIIPKNKVLAIISGMTLGFFFPSCECGIVPVVKELVRKGVPSYTAIAFMVTAPIINPVVLFSTYIAFNNLAYPVFLRVIGSLIVGLVVGLWLAYKYKDDILLVEVDGCDTCGVTKTPTRFAEKVYHALTHSVDEFFDTGRYLVIGALLASAMQIFLQTSWLYPLAKNPITAVLAMLLLAFVLSLCSEADAFIGATMVSLFGLGPVIAFLVLGSMVDIKNLLMMKRHFKTEFIWKLIVIIVVIVFIYGLII
ncbi:permease [Vagococcus coleopterorum]|uniref:Permease n=1 Tax=Vagococcus coleopterorum TaxID=2714946 RepID=A0A6G8AMQ1_9ENTE|nr:permease [Vagococcus coleopterorum]QIL46239.1 permease [Vagococcus coleopterorum]